MKLSNDNRSVENLPGEVWCKHPTFDRIWASNHGRIKRESFSTKVNGTTKVHTAYYRPVILKQSPQGDGFRVSFKYNGKTYHKRVHRLIWECFNQETLKQSDNVIVDKDGILQRLNSAQYKLYLETR